MQLAMKVGVPVVPGTPGPVADYKEGESFIKQYGFPGKSKIMLPFSWHM